MLFTKPVVEDLERRLVANSGIACMGPFTVPAKEFDIYF